MSETQILDKLDSIEKGQKRSSFLTQASIGFAVSIFALNSIESTDPTYQKIVATILCLASLYWFVRNISRYFRTVGAK
jgi:hypothetical protein